MSPFLNYTVFFFSEGIMSSARYRPKINVAEKWWVDAIMCPIPGKCFINTAVTLHIAYKHFTTRWSWCHFTFYFLLQVIVLWVHLKWWQCHYAKALKSRACVKGSALCVCFVPCVAWWQQFVKYTGKVTAVTAPCHLAVMTPLHSSHDLRIAPVF